MQTLLSPFISHGFQSLSPFTPELKNSFGQGGEKGAAALLEQKLFETLAKLGSDKASQAIDHSPQAVAGRIVNYVESAINSRAKTADEADEMLAQARQGIAQGIADARDILQSLGQLSNAINEQITQTDKLINEGLDSLQLDLQPVPARLSEQGRVLSESYQYASQYRQSSLAAIEIMTQDGDRVEISYSSLSQSMTEKSVNINAASGGQQSEFSLSHQASASVSFQFSVQGDIDEGEQQAIDALLKDLGDIASRFFDGDVQSAFESAMQLGMDTGELKSLSMDLRQSTEIQVAEQYQRSLLNPAQLTDGLANGLASAQSPKPAVDILSQLEQLLERLEDTNLQQPQDDFKQLLSQLLGTLNEGRADDLLDYMQRAVEAA